jgi:hypothetical protein
MSEESEKKPADTKPEESEAAKAKKAKVDEQEVGDFIRRNVLEKDSVFFEG